MSGRLWSAWSRLLLVQASFGYERMIGLGIAFAMRPLLPVDSETGRPRSDAIARSAEFFNSHPYFAGAAVGALARAEHDGLPTDQISRLRSTLVGPLGAMGDRLFWVGVVRVASGVGIVLAALVSITLGVVVFLVLYNVPHLWVRYWTIRAGWEEGADVGKALGRPVVAQAARSYTRLAALLVGMAIPVAATRLIGSFPGAPLSGALAVALATAVTVKWLIPAFGGVRIAMLAGVAALVGGVVWL